MMHELPVPSKLPICVEVRESFFEKKIEDKKLSEGYEAFLRCSNDGRDVWHSVFPYPIES